jgi:hypothetical protein
MIVIEFMENGALDAFLRVSTKVILPFQTYYVSANIIL